MDDAQAARVLGLARQKQAELTAEQAQAARDAAAGQASAGVRSEALARAGKALLFGLGVGGAGAGVAGLADLFRRNATRKAYRKSGPARLDMSLGVKRADLSEGFAAARSSAPTPPPAAAALAAPPATPWYQDPLGFLAGGHAATPASVPWANGLALALAGGGLLAGKGLVSGALEHVRDDAGDAELAAARRTYERALRGGRDDEKEAGDAGDAGLAAELDALADACEKAAAGEDGGWLASLLGSVMPSADTAGAAMNAYGAYAIPAALGVGALAYGHGKAHSRRAVLDAALKRRQRERASRSPIQLFASPGAASFEG